MHSLTAEERKKPLIYDRIIKHIKGEKTGPTVVFFGGIHGNEQAGVKALTRQLSALEHQIERGNIYGIYGNLKALNENKRFIDEDLNRMWTDERLTSLDSVEKYTNEEQELKAIYTFLASIFKYHDQPLYFIDLHTTSSDTLPFITINDALINRKFAEHFPCPTVLGIEEYLNGPLLSYLNTLGYVSLGFESGQHKDPEAITNSEAFIYLVLQQLQVLKPDNTLISNKYIELLKKASCNISDMFEVIYKYHIEDGEDFKMLKGFKSFQKIKKGTRLAISDEALITSNYNSRIFMPLYQKVGKDGFFIIRKIAPFFLKLSLVLRNIKADNLLILLPGITWHNKQKGILKANLKVTVFLAKQLFHLLGYRNRQIDSNHILIFNRERVSKTEMYQNEPWFKGFS